MHYCTHLSDLLQFSHSSLTFEMDKWPKLRENIKIRENLIFNVEIVHKYRQNKYSKPKIANKYVHGLT